VPGALDLVDDADVWVIQRGRGFGLALKTAEGQYIVGQFVGQKPQGDVVAAEFEVFRLVDDAHPTASDLAEDTVMGKSSAPRVGRAWTLGRHVRWVRERFWIASSFGLVE
jgi:hypothetical protein